MLTDNDKKKDRKSPARRAVSATTNRPWSDSQKLETVTTYLMLGGNVALTAATLKIPEVTVRYWKKSEWWQEVESELRREENLQLSARLKNLVEKSLDVVADRLENGDWIYDQKTGELKRKPVILKDAHKVAVDLVDKRQKLQTNENFTVAAEQIEDKLSKLAKAFEDLASKKPKLEVTDVVFVEGESNEIEVIPGDSVHGDAGSTEETKTLPSV